MKIRKDLLQFDTHKALFVVTGTKEADFYIAQAGEINKVRTFTVEKPKYSDREDYGSRSGGLVFESGSVTEAIKKSMQLEFVKQLKNSFKELGKEKFDHVYIFCPAPIHNVLESTLPTALRKKVVRVWKGNYHNESVLKLLEKIK